ncbi:serine/threonine-protein kinase NIM1-like [Planoprotostelium fungivorum]|uniref:non-specific serine/threonine protein kinase n=1 Tax=Planoprotostelium fungivorum TaxID=1890364 RepID=A0A2P6NMB1_9EUKA|nr:serine/threonine-protein kinase NIM1-like [Planoprotostelium fungivorum]
MRKDKTIGAYFIGETLGWGNFSKVKLGSHATTGEKVALKFISHKLLDISRLRREIEIHSRVQHHNIVRLIEVAEIEGATCLVMEYVRGMDLFTFIDTHSTGKLQEKEARQIFSQIVSAVVYLHENSFVHRDIKLENIMITPEGTCKLIDFGFAAEWNVARALKTPCGSPIYAAPEIFRQESYIGPKTDVWAMGVLLYCLVSGKVPWSGRDAREQIVYMVEGNWCEGQLKGNSQALHDLIRGCLTPHVDSRYGTYDIVDSPWLAGGMEESKQPVKKRLRRKLITGALWTDLRPRSASVQSASTNVRYAWWGSVDGQLLFPRSRVLEDVTVFVWDTTEPSLFSRSRIRYLTMIAPLDLLDVSLNRPHSHQTPSGKLGPVKSIRVLCIDW